MIPSLRTNEESTMAKTTTKTGKAPAKAAPPPPAAPVEGKTRSAKAAPAGNATAAVAAKTSAPAKATPSAAVQVAKPTTTTVTLRQLAASLAERHALPKKQVDALLADVFGDVVAHLKAGERVRIGGLGIIKVKNRPARVARNPATGAPVQVAASKKIAFLAAKELKEAI